MTKEWHSHTAATGRADLQAVARVARNERCVLIIQVRCGHVLQADCARKRESMRAASTLAVCPHGAHQAC